MGLNKVSGNMYREILGQKLTHTWNPLGGECPHKCVYCSTGKLMRYPVIKSKYTGNPRIDVKNLNINLGSGNFIFVVAQNDLFAASIPAEFIEKVLTQCRKYPDNKYLFQSKNPKRFIEFINKFPEKLYLCTTIETNRENSYPSNAPSIKERVLAMIELNNLR